MKKLTEKDVKKIALFYVASIIIAFFLSMIIKDSGINVFDLHFDIMMLLAVTLGYIAGNKM